MSQRFYRPELDVVRFLAFLAVFLHHALGEGSTYGAFGALTAGLGFGLPLFFTLSAYLITTLLLEERERTGTVDLRRFYLRRALRIWPLYFGALAVSVAVAVLHHTWHKTELWYLAAIFMLANAVHGITPSVLHLWSISVEEQFYVFWPTLMRRLSRRTLTVLAGVLIVVANVVLARYGIRHAETWERPWYNTFIEMEFFAGGILLALHDDRRTLHKLPAVVRTGAFVAVPLLWFAATRVFHCKDPFNPAPGPWSMCLGYGVAAVGCVLLIYAVQGLQRWPAPAVYFGRISYGLYVFHAWALGGVAHFTHGRGAVGTIVEVLVGLSVTMALAALSYRWYETPFLRMKERFEVVKSRPVEA